MPRHHDQVGDARPSAVIAHDHQAGIVPRREARGHRGIGPVQPLAAEPTFLGLEFVKSAQMPPWKSATGELAAKAVRGAAPELGQKPWAATQPSDRTRAFWVGPLKTAASSAKPRLLQGMSSSAMRQHGRALVS